MHLLLVGLNHESAPLAIRETVAFGSTGVRRALERLQALSVKETALLSTCNRTEIYAVLPSADPLRLLCFLEETAASTDLRNHLYQKKDEEAARHLLRVACGLDSMIVGEGQILSQVKAALQQADEAGTVGGHLSSLFRHALAAGKRARSETGIARGAVSISNAAIHLARELFGDLSDNTALVIGAGDTAELTMRLLSDAGVSSMLVVNRTHGSAVELAAVMHGRAMRFDELEEALIAADIVISSTAAPHFIVRHDLMQRVMRRRRDRPLFLIDIAVPRDVEQRVGDLPNVFLYNIDDLRRVVDENLEQRAAEFGEVERIVSEELDRFLIGWRSLSLAPLLQALQEHMEEIRCAELAKSGRRLSRLDETEHEAVELLTRGIIKRILKAPIASLKAHGGTSQGAMLFDSLRLLFDLPETTISDRLRPDERIDPEDTYIPGSEFHPSNDLDPEMTGNGPCGVKRGSSADSQPSGAVTEDRRHLLWKDRRHQADDDKSVDAGSASEAATERKESE